MILEHYNLTPPITQFDLPNSGINNTTVGIRTGDGDFVFKHFDVPHGIEGLEYEQNLLTWLAKQSLSFGVPALIPTTLGQTYYQNADGYHALMPLLKGHRPVHKDLVQTEAIGAALGELQTTLSQYPTTPRPYMATFADLNSIHPSIPNPEFLTPRDLGWPQTESATSLCAWWRDEFEKLNIFLSETYPKLPTQVIHGDYGPGNTLYHKDRISAILDFEFALPSIRIMDIASGLTFSMRIWENDDPWDVAAHFYCGYSQQIKLTELELASIIDAIILRDTAAAIWWWGRDLSAKKKPDTRRMSDLRTFKSWLKNNRSRLESLWFSA